MMSKNRTTHIITVISVALFIVLGLASGTTEPATNTGNSSGGQGTQARSSGSGQRTAQAVSETSAPESYFTGNGGKGMRLAVLEPSVNGLTEDEKKWMPSTIQSSITGDFNRFSAMTIIDRQNFEKILAEQTLSMSGNFSDKDFIRIGHLINTRYILVGSVIRTATAYMLELSVADVESGERKASYPPTQVSPLNLENLTAVKEATAVLLQQLGVQLTAQGRQELRKTPDTAAVQAEVALARGITAQRQGTEVAALSYFFQAEALNPTLLEATSRSSILNTNISSGNIGEDVRNDIVWRRNWVGRLTEAEQSFAEFNRTESMRYTLFYSDEIKQGAVNYQNETVTLSIETNLRPSHTWGRSVGLSMQRTLRAVYDGLQATKRTGDWGLNGWPSRGVTNLNSFARQEKSFTIIAELLNDRNQVIGRQSFRADGYWGFTYNQNAPSGISISDDDKTTVNFTVKADDITNRLTIRIASVNGVDAETAARNGALQVRAMPKTEYDRNNTNSSKFNFALGEIRGPGSRFDFERQVRGGAMGRDGALLSIPPNIWDDPVVAIGKEAFNRRVSSDHPYISIYLPDSVTSIGERAFRNYYITSKEGYSFENTIIYRISIGTNVTMEDNSFGFQEMEPNSKSPVGFVRQYRNKNRSAGVYETQGFFNSWAYKGPR